MHTRQPGSISHGCKAPRACGRKKMSGAAGPELARTAASAHSRSSASWHLRRTSLRTPGPLVRRSTPAQGVRPRCPTPKSQFPASRAGDAATAMASQRSAPPCWASPARRRDAATATRAERAPRDRPRAVRVARGRPRAPRGPGAVDRRRDRDRAAALALVRRARGAAGVAGGARRRGCGRRRDGDRQLRLARGRRDRGRPRAAACARLRARRARAGRSRPSRAASTARGSRPSARTSRTSPASAGRASRSRSSTRSGRA